MSDAKKPMVVWIEPGGVEYLATSPDNATSREHVYTRPFYGSERPHLLLPIEDGALRVGDMLFRLRSGPTAGVAECRTDDDPPGEWMLASRLDLFDLIMDAVEGVEP